MESGTFGIACQAVDEQQPELSAEDWAMWWKQAGGWQLRQILFWRWDPIGVAEMGGFPTAYDEYDSYAGPVASALRRGEGANGVEDALRGFEHDNMGLTITAAADRHRRKVAEFIAEWYPASIAWWRERGIVA